MSVSESVQELMRIHVETLFTHDDRQRLVCTNEGAAKAAPRFFLGRTVQGSVRRFRHDVDDELVKALTAACLDEQLGELFMHPPHGATRYEQILAPRAPIEKKWTGPVYRFPDQLPAPPAAVLVTEKNATVLRPYLEAWLGDVATCHPFLARIVDGQAVSICCSVRTASMAHEAGVETARDFRGRGYAAQVVSAWASTVRKLNRIPLYSTSWQNTASLAVAAKLGLIRYGIVLHLTWMIDVPQALRIPWRIMRVLTSIAVVALVLSNSVTAAAQQAARTLVLVSAHADDEAPVAPILARYAREGVQVYMIIATDGAQGGAYTTIPRGPELARVRADEARCAADALGARPPILLGFPDGKLGDYTSDPALLFRLTQNLAQELQRLRPDVILTWGPDGGYGHPDHRLVSNLVTQLQRAGAPGVTQRIFHMYIPEEGIRAQNPQRGVPPMVIPEAKHFTTRVSFTPEDLAAAERSMVCHKTQFTDEMRQRVVPAMERGWNGIIALIPAFSTAPSTDLFR